MVTPPLPKAEVVQPWTFITGTSRSTFTNVSEKFLASCSSYFTIQKFWISQLLVVQTYFHNTGRDCTELTVKLSAIPQLVLSGLGTSAKREVWEFLHRSIRMGGRETHVWILKEQIYKSKDILLFQCRNTEQHYLFACQVNFISALNMEKWRHWEAVQLSSSEK